MAKLLLLAAAISVINPDAPAMEYAKHFLVISEQHGEDPFLTTATGIYESALDNEIVSHKGACCLMQIMGGKYKVFPACRKVQNDVELCIDAGIAYMAMLRKRYGSDEEVLCHYNCGNVCTKGSRKNYVRGVLWWRQHLLAIASQTPAGLWHCSVQIDDPAGTIVEEGTAPVWVRAIKHGRPAIRNYEEKVVKSLKLLLKYRTCNMKHLGEWDGRYYLDRKSEAFACLTSRRTYSCTFEELHRDNHEEILEAWAAQLEAPASDLTWNGGDHGDTTAR